MQCPKCKKKLNIYRTLPLDLPVNTVERIQICYPCKQKYRTTECIVEQEKFEDGINYKKGVSKIED